MVDLIDRDELLKTIAKLKAKNVMSYVNYTRHAAFEWTKGDIYKIIKEFPPAQPELVWCKDCKWYDPTHPYGTIVADAFHCKVNDKFYKVSHFCGYGERREDG